MANPNLSGRPLHVWIHLLFMNGVWVLIPAILLFDSCIILTRAASAAKLELSAHQAPPSGRRAYVAIAATLALYAVLVPGVMWYAKQNP